MKKLQKKAQMETMGLLVVVILISIILFFALSFSMKSKDTTNTKKEFKETQAISNFGTAMLETTGPCDWTIRELLTDCAFTKEINCDGVNSCDAAKSMMTMILNVSLNEWGYKYNLSIDTSTKNVFSESTGCNSVGERSNSNTETTPFGTTHGSMVMKIITCE
ncbi:MAG: hypothetical protein WC758_03105 [Candidatus Woesearchaeota archaeon]|jgi:hypothetical protein